MVDVGLCRQKGPHGPHSASIGLHEFWCLGLPEPGSVAGRARVVVADAVGELLQGDQSGLPEGVALAVARLSALGLLQRA